ncbi:hypothetical protein SNOG_02646 [Parastagonospora nodorum SN15]|uniref:Uncharacterized protein n=1 Tax=Phaeosphaeria nodorum (strain SN15 / ATCC MYA-4574 / FGSC 10173) TaxID=321614 RepID=Q0V018_PHANO|nr:hypothetical protein SNOG_02646 [Parastagonospora nodorum SN15]EAT89377.1 hypothetical protein SNOG_02646 [Parastagonospora nodorum SN15]
MNDRCRRWLPDGAPRRSTVAGSQWTGAQHVPQSGAIDSSCRAMQPASANGDAPENWEGWGEVGSASTQRLLARRHGSPSAERRANHGLAYEMHGTLQLHGSTKMRRPTVRQAAARRGAPSPRQFGRDGEAIELQSPGQQPHSAALRVRTCLGANVIRRRRARSIASFDEASKHAKRGSLQPR